MNREKYIPPIHETGTYQSIKIIFSLMPLFVAGFGSFGSVNVLTWIVAWGVFIITFGMITISEQIETLINKSEGVKNYGEGNL